MSSDEEDVAPIPAVLDDEEEFEFPGVSFLLGALFMLFSLLIAWYVLNREKKLAAARV